VEFYGTVGVALATVIVYFVSKLALIAYNYFKLKINPLDYIPFKWYAFYSFILGAIFILLDRGIMEIDFIN
jgi:Na+-driven multidrug efflux pump